MLNMNLSAVLFAAITSLVAACGSGDGATNGDDTTNGAGGDTASGEDSEREIGRG